MTHSRLFARALLVASLASGCASDDDDIWMPAGGADGKADGFTTIHGSDIPSQFADPNKWYVIARRIDNLNTVGAFDMVQSGLATRVDGIIANLPADGRLQLAELVRMESPAIHASLFANEKAALPKLWKLLEAPDDDAVVKGPKNSFGTVDASLAPGAAIPPATLGITTLPTEVQAAATRLQNVHDNDGDTTTVSLADLAAGVANPAAFTPTEVTAFGTIQAIFRDKAVATATAQVELSPGPGTATTNSGFGPVSLKIATLTKIDEQRQQNYTTLTTSLVATQTVTTTAVMPMGAQVLVIDQSSGTETVFGAGQVPSALTAGDAIVEVWQGGQRAFSANSALPPLTATKTLQLGDKLDYTLVSGLATLVRNLTTATYANGWYTTHYTYDAMTVPPPAGITQQAVTATASPAVNLPIGRYTLGPSATLYVYPGNVMWFGWGGQTVRMLPQGNNGQAPTRLASPQSPQPTFDAASNSFTCSYCSPQINVRLTSSSRDI